MVRLRTGMRPLVGVLTPGRVVADGRGQLYIDDPVHGRVQVYSLSGEYIRTIPVVATQLGADPSGRVYGIVRGGLALLNGDSAAQLRPYRFIMLEALRVAPDGTVVVKVGASETKSSARVIAFGPDGSVEELEDSGMFLNTVDGRRVDSDPPLRASQRGRYVSSPPGGRPHRGAWCRNGRIISPFFGGSNSSASIGSTVPTSIVSLGSIRVLPAVKISASSSTLWTSRPAAL